MKQKKRFEDLEFSDGFLFVATLEDEELCRLVLERILEMPIKKVRVQKESVISVNPEYRGIRMDVFADDERREGREEGRNECIVLMKAMLIDGRMEEVPRLQEDPQFLTEMLEHYHIREPQKHI